MRFSFVGALQLNDESSKVPYVRSGKTKNGDKYKTFSCGVKAADNNMAWGVELFGMDADTIKTVNSKGDKIEIDRGDRFDKDVISDVASYRKFVIKIDDDRNEYISAYDAVSFLAENADVLKKGRYRITGMVNKDFYEGKTRDRFQIQNVYKIEDDEVKNGLTCNTIYYLNKDSIDTADWADEKKINIDGYISTYISSEKKNMYVNQQIVFDASKIDFDNEKHVNLLKFKLKMIGCELTSDNKIKVTMKSGKVYSSNVVLRYSNGAEQEEVTMDMLSDTQKEAIELGLKTLDDFKGSVYGERKTQYKLVDFILKDDYEDGLKDEDIKTSEFEEDVYVVSALSSSEPKKKAKDVEIDMNKPEDGDEELDSLFD